VTFIDDYSRYVWVYFIRNKSDVFLIFKRWRARVENQTGKKVKVIRNDNGGEYGGNAFNSYCADEGIKRHYTDVYTPQ
jgi:transposase InsO family protein